MSPDSFGDMELVDGFNQGLMKSLFKFERTTLRSRSTLTFTELVVFILPVVGSGFTGRVMDGKGRTVHEEVGQEPLKEPEVQEP